jgi:chromodomain-helicase-DNA-binding protein 7
MFERASRKLGLEHAVLGGHNFRDEEGGEAERAIEKPSSKEMEQLLRQGAYALLEDDDEDAREFCEDDIDKIMAERTHRIVVDAPGKTANWLSKKAGFRKRAFQTGSGKSGDVDVNDPDFWSKVRRFSPGIEAKDGSIRLCVYLAEQVMPDLKTPDALQRRFTALEQDDGRSAEALLAFFADVESMVTGLVDLHKRNKCPPRDREDALVLLLKISIKEDLFSHQQREQATQWRLSLEGPRVRACRQDVYEASDEEEQLSPVKKRNRKSSGRDLESHSDVCVVSPRYYS